MSSRYHGIKLEINHLIGFANPFCVLGLSADADGSMIHQAAQRALMECRLREHTKQKNKEINLIESAYEQLKDPLIRFYASLYWVTLNLEEQASWGNPKNVRMLAFDNYAFTGDTYENIGTATSVSVRTHNLAVLACADARRLAENEMIQNAAQVWVKGFNFWGVCLSSNDFIRRQVECACRLDDPRLTVFVANEFIRSIPKNLLAVPAQLVERFLDRRKSKEAAGLVAIIRNAPFDKNLVDGALESVCTLLIHRIETAIDALDRQRQRIVASAYNSSNAKVSVDDWTALLSEFKTRVSPDLEQILNLGNLPGLLESKVCDQAAQFLEQLAMGSWGLLGDAKIKEEAVRLARRYAHNPETIMRLEGLQTRSDEESAAISEDAGEQEKTGHREGSGDAAALESRLIQILRKRPLHKNLVSEINVIMKIAETEKAPEAVYRLRELKEQIASSEAKALITELIHRVSNEYVVRLYDEATQIVAMGMRLEEALQKLENAREWVTRPEDQAIIDQQILHLKETLDGSIVSKKAGCAVLPALLAFGVTLISAALLGHGAR